MAGFVLRKNLSGSHENPVLLEFLIKNSGVVQVGDMVRLTTSGVATRVAAGEGILGQVAGVVDKNGLRLTPDSGTTDTFTVASDNQTVAQKKVQVIPALPNYLFSNTTGGTLATTNLMQFFDLSDEATVNQGSATDTATAQVQLVGLDPDGDGDATKGLFRVVETEIGQTGTQNIAA